MCTNARFWPKADPENWSFAVVKASALEKSRHSGFVSESSVDMENHPVSRSHQGNWRRWAKDTEGLPKRPFKSLILKGEKRVKVTINSKVLGVHVDTLEAA
jgi:hypothetical protein